MGQSRSLSEFNTKFREYLRSYNTSMHSGIGCTPFERYQTSERCTRIPQSREWLDECFLTRIFRKVRKDATVSIDKLSYDVPMQFIDQKVEIRFRPGEMDSAVIIYENERFPLRPTDKNENCRTKRRNGPSIDYAKLGGHHV